ncbi:MAG: hypothetical protein AMJ81_05705 [Phycisphaerae bacterium SM23_33]|nr:MAG: hypothetical protein AMJ81_05705 [Phycisphaerae bacterium SM23_33]
MSSSVPTVLPVTRWYSSAWVLNSLSNVEQDSSPGYQGWSVRVSGSPTPPQAGCAATNTTKNVHGIRSMTFSDRSAPKLGRQTHQPISF